VAYADEGPKKLKRASPKNSVVRAARGSKILEPVTAGKLPLKIKLKHAKQILGEANAEAQKHVVAVSISISWKLALRAASERIKATRAMKRGRLSVGRPA
jgi:hypothetical protein